jgi:hypothetical protein
MRKLTIALSAVFAVAALAPAAGAATIDVDYALTGGFVQVGGQGTATFGPPLVTNAKAKLRYDSTATPPGSIVPGAVHIQSFSFFQPWSIKTLFSVPGATMYGYVGFQFSASQGGALSGGGSLVLPALAGLQPLPGVHCNAVACGILGLTGFTSITFSAGTPFTGLSLVGTGHLGTAPGTIALSVPQLTNFLGAAVAFNVTGTEVSRTYIPEPATGTMLGLGLLSLAAFSGLARRRR